MTTKSTAEHTPESDVGEDSARSIIDQALAYCLAQGYLSGHTLKSTYAAFIAGTKAPETAAERDRLRAENASLQEALEHVIREVYWFVNRKKNLAEIVAGDNRVWADVLDEDLDIARAALARHAKAEGRS